MNCREQMPRYTVPKNIGKVRVAITLGHKYTVWNGKQGKGEFVIPCRTRQQAEQVAEMINRKRHGGEIDVD
jgi:hypothetical protein